MGPSSNIDIIIIIVTTTCEQINVGICVCVCSCTNNTSPASYRQGKVKGGSRILVWELGALAGSLGDGGTEVPQWFRGRARRMLRHEAKNHLRREKNTSMQTDIVRQLSSNSLVVLRFQPFFVLKYKTQSAGSKANQMVHNGSHYSTELDGELSCVAINWPLGQARRKSYTRTQK